jgi:hypothetical protein
VLDGKIVEAALVIFEFTDRNLYQIEKKAALQLSRLKE